MTTPPKPDFTKSSSKNDDVHHTLVRDDGQYPSWLEAEWNQYRIFHPDPSQLPEHRGPDGLAGTLRPWFPDQSFTISSARAADHQRGEAPRLRSNEDDTNYVLNYELFQPPYVNFQQSKGDTLFQGPRNLPLQDHPPTEMQMSMQKEQYRRQWTCTECGKIKSRECDLRKHMRRHTRPYSCRYPNCPKLFGSRNDWKRHENSQHLYQKQQTLKEMWECRHLRHDNSRCGEVAYERDIFAQHLREDHGIDLNSAQNERDCQDMRLDPEHGPFVRSDTQTLVPDESVDEFQRNCLPPHTHNGDSSDCASPSYPIRSKQMSLSQQRPVQFTLPASNLREIRPKPPTRRDTYGQPSIMGPPADKKRRGRPRKDETQPKNELGDPSLQLPYMDLVEDDTFSLAQDSEDQPNSAFANRIDEAVVTLGPPTDSGYHSMDKLERSNESQNLDDNEDNASIATDGRASMLDVDTAEKLSLKFATEILDELDIPSDFPQDSISQVAMAAQELLRDFAIMTQSRARSATEQAAVTFVRHSRGRIARHIRGHLQSTFARKNLPGGKPMDLAEKFERWDVDPCSQDDSNTCGQTIPDHDDDGLDPVEDFDMSTIPNLQEAKNFLLRGEEYKWLLTRMTTNFSMGSADSTSRYVRTAIIDSFSDRPRIEDSQSLSLVVKLAWDPEAFLIEQFPLVGVKTDLGSVITLSGAGDDAFAVTCKEYVELMWPSLGSTVLDCVKDALLSDIGHSTIDRSEIHLRIYLSNGMTSFTATRQLFAIVEATEILVWLGAACRAYANAGQPAMCQPVISKQSTHPTVLDVDYAVVALQTSDSNEEATCWHQMFRNPVISKDYPMPTRLHNERGLETSLDMMTLLGQTPTAESFCGRILLKGWNSIMAPIERVGSSFKWHFLVNKDRARMSYRNGVNYTQLASYADVLVAGSRHFVGWTPSANIVAGE